MSGEIESGANVRSATIRFMRGCWVLTIKGLQGEIRYRVRVGSFGAALEAFNDWVKGVVIV